MCELHAPGQSPFCRDESRPDNLLVKIGAQGRTQTFNLWFVGPALRQLSYSGRRWWSELESNQPFGLFRPALIRLSYPTVGGRGISHALRLRSLCTLSMTSLSSCTSLNSNFL